MDESNMLNNSLKTLATAPHTSTSAGSHNPIDGSALASLIWILIFHFDSNQNNRKLWKWNFFCIRFAFSIVHENRLRVSANQRASERMLTCAPQTYVSARLSLRFIILVLTLLFGSVIRHPPILMLFVAHCIRITITHTHVLAHAYTNFIIKFKFIFIGKEKVNLCVAMGCARSLYNVLSISFYCHDDCHQAENAYNARTGVTVWWMSVWHSDERNGKTHRRESLTIHISNGIHWQTLGRRTQSGLTACAFSFPMVHPMKVTTNHVWLVSIPAHKRRRRERDVQNTGAFLSDLRIIHRSKGVYVCVSYDMIIETVERERNHCFCWKTLVNVAINAAGNHTVQLPKDETRIIFNNNK